MRRGSRRGRSGARRLVGERRPVARRGTARGPRTAAAASTQPLLRQQRRRRRASSSMKARRSAGSRVERHVGAAGLEDAEQADDHLERALDARGRPAPRGRRRAARQVVRQLVGARVELARRSAAARRRRTATASGVRAHLRLEQLVDAAIARIVGARRVPLDAALAPLGLVEQRQRADAALGIGRRCLRADARSAAPCARSSLARTGRWRTPSIADAVRAPLAQRSA